MHLNVTRHVFQDLGGMGDINSVEGNEGNDLQDLLDPGGAPQDTKMGYTANVDTRPVPGTPRKEANVLSTTREGERIQRKEFSNSTSNPTVASKNATSAHETTDSDLPRITTETALMPPDASQPPNPSKPH